MCSAKIRTSIKKEEVNSMPLLVFEGKVHLIDDDSQVEEALAYLKNEKVIGFDTESKPAFKKGEHYPISLLQLSSQTEAFLFRLNKISNYDSIYDLLSDGDILKVGVAIRDDLVGLQKLQKFTAGGFVEIADMAVELKIKNLGLRNLAGICFEKRISKGAKLSNWEAPVLKEVQQSYAATDAWIGLKIYQHLNMVIKDI